MEIMFFGVTGETRDENPLESVLINDTSYNVGNQIFSDYDCEVTLLDSDM